MQFKPDARWRSFTRFAPFVNAIALLLSIAVLVMGCVLAKQLNHARLHETPYKSTNFSFDQSQAAFYNVTTPLISTIFGMAELLRHFHSSARPLTSLIMSVIIFLGWIINFALWTNCDLGEFADGGQLGFCENWPKLGGSDALTSPLQYARFAFALFAMIAHGVGVGFAGTAFWNKGKWQGVEVGQGQKMRVGSNA